jgi:RimJ/RimL family protein N-acetyltransferase
LKEHVAQLKDGTEVLIRPLRIDDLDRSLAFFQALPGEDRTYLRVDVTKRDLVERRICSALRSDKIKRIVALIGEEIVGDGALEVGGDEWDRHVAELRVVIARPFQRRGLGTLMMRELYAEAASWKVQEIVVRIMRPQKAAWAICRKLGFQEEVLLHDYLKDISGHKQDLILMRCDLEELWQRMEDFIERSDWRGTRHDPD